MHYGGELKSHKGMNLPGIEVSAPALTEKDLEDVAQAAALGVDYVALSFVRRPEDIEQLRALVPRSTKLVAKIEKDTALRNLCGILDASDAIMVARGDLGVELPFEEVPLMQKQIIREAGPPRQAGDHRHPDARVHGPRARARPGPRRPTSPTRSSTAPTPSCSRPRRRSASIPLEAVRAMDRIAREMELPAPGPRRDHRRRARAAARARAMALPQHRIGAERAGPDRGRHRGRGLRRGGDARARRSSSASPAAASPRARSPPAVPPCRSSPARPSPRPSASSSLVWGVTPALTEHFTDYDTMLAVARQQILERGLAQPGERLVVTAGVPFDMPGTTNLLKIEAV